MELTLDISVVDDRRYKIAASDGTGTFQRIISNEFSASIREDMRLLRWKATGLHDSGDALLTDVGRRILWEATKGIPEGAAKSSHFRHVIGL
jgi:hypothetical protein